MGLPPRSHDREHWVLQNFQEADLLLRGNNLVSFIRDCWRDSDQCKIHDPEADHCQRALICQLGGTDFMLELDGPAELDFEQNRELLVSVTRNGRVHGFTTRVRDLDVCEGGGPDRVRFDLPKLIRSSQVRRALRIPTAWSRDLSLELLLPGQRIPADLMDLSLGGFRAAVRGRIHDLERGEEIVARIRFADHEITEPVKIANRNGLHLGFQFPAFVRLEGFMVTDEYRDLLLAVGEAWYRPRADMPKYSKRMKRAFLVEWMDNGKVRV